MLCRYLGVGFVESEKIFIFDKLFCFDLFYSARFLSGEVRAEQKSMGGWHKVALEQLRKLGSALARHTGQEEGETISHLHTRASVLLQKGLSALLLNRIPSHPAPDVGGVL